MATNGNESRLLETARELSAERVSMLQELIRHPSVTGDEGPLQTFLYKTFVDAGLDTQLQEIEFEQVAPYLPGTKDRDFSGRPNVIARLRGAGGGRSLLLNAHADTVTAGQEGRWSYPPFEGVVADGAVWGRGACDMKASIVACFYAMLAIKRANVALQGDIVLAVTVGEESGGAGAIAYALNGDRTDAAIVTEPTRLAIAPAHAGAAQLRITLQGESAHACTRGEGVSAIEKFVGLFSELVEYEKARIESVTHPLFRDLANPVPLNVGVVRGGEWPSMVPEEVELEGRIGLVPGENIDEVCALFEEHLQTWAQADPWLREHRLRVDWTGSRFAPSEIDVDAPISKVIAGAYEDVLGKPPVIEGVTFGADMTHFVNTAGIPTLLFGPGDIRRAHKTNEMVPIAELDAATAVLAQTAVLWCGIDE